jgi:flagellar biosynthesis protein FliQ
VQGSISLHFTPPSVLFGGDTQGRVRHMSFDNAVDLIRHCLLLTLLIAAPTLIVGLVVGFVISLFQAVTQLQEQTLSFIPRIVAMLAAAIFLLPWAGGHLIEYARQMFSNGL